MRRTASIAILGLAAIAATTAYVVSVSAAEEPPHTVVVRDGDFEIRDYLALTIAEVTVLADRSAAAYAGFRKLASYIFGSNAEKRKIEMTAPVIEARAGGEGQEAWTIRFVMPNGSILATMPKPNDPSVRMMEAPPTRYAVVRFAGVADDGSTEAKTRELRMIMRARGLEASGAPVIAQYNPPWIPGFMRRNEIMIPLR